MKYQMPEPAEIQSFGNSKPLGYTYADMCEAFDAGRAAGLEAAAAYLLAAGFRSTGIPAYERFADAIRNLSKETPCLDGTKDSAKTTAVSLDAGLQADLAQGNNLGDKT